MADTPEGRVKEKIDAMLDSLGWWYFKPQTHGYGRSGIPDYMGITDQGMAFSIEAKPYLKGKRGYAPLTPWQKRENLSMMDKGSRAVWLGTVDADGKLIVRPFTREELQP